MGTRPGEDVSPIATAESATESPVFVSVSHVPGAIGGAFTQPTASGSGISTASRYATTGIGSQSTYVSYALASTASLTGF